VTRTVESSQHGRPDTPSPLTSLSALESDFPAVRASTIAEAESWRKEVHRPATHTHKWWAQRLGSVFRHILTAAVARTASEANKMYDEGADALKDIVVFDPFAGSGTTLFEVAKLGGTPIGMDINPVATLVQRQSLQTWTLEELERGFSMVSDLCREEIDRLHRDAAGNTVLYYFWVALAACPTCQDTVRLFSRHVFAQHAYPKKYPRAQAVCPLCLAVVETTSDFSMETCARGHAFTNQGAVVGARMTCRNGHQTRVIDALGGRVPDKEMYAKLVVSELGEKRYESIDDFDRSIAEEATLLLREHREKLVLPLGELKAGYNTRQAMSWGHRKWEDFFNDRQLYCLGLLAAAIRDLHIAPPEREALAALFSGTLEFNNLFCSFKGEGTGAVRHMFSHHILKPERMVLEAHPWGTRWSSGSFSTLFKSRLIRAHEHKTRPTDLFDDLALGKVVKRAGTAVPRHLEIVNAWPKAGLRTDQALVRPGDSGVSGMPDDSVDLVITDPPYMDNVHYSELADFFHAWLRGIQPFDGYPVDPPTTRAQGEVQSTSAEGFEHAITSVWTECSRVTKPLGLMAFTFHQARIEGWVALVKSLASAGWEITAVQPVTGEMSTSITKSGAKEPSSLDSIIVCRHRGSIAIASDPEAAGKVATERLARLIEGGVNVGAGDVRSVLRGSVLALYTVPESQLSLDALCREADRLATEAISGLLG